MQKSSKQKRIKRSKWSDFYIFLTRRLGSVFVVLGLRKTRKFWGIIYDSKTRQPLDPVMVKLVSAGNNRESQNCITDMAGRYGFLVDPGKYKIIPKKSNYIFPSQIIPGSSDGVFTDLYHGEFFGISGESDVVAPNIPMDPAEADWNQNAKLKYVNTYPNIKYFFKLLIGTAFWLGFILDIIFLVKDFIKNSTISNYWLVVLMAGYLVLFFLNKAVPQMRLWGRVKINKSQEPLEGILLEVASFNWPDSVLAKTKTNSEGKFFLRVNPGKYLLRFKFLKDNGETEELGQITAIARKEAVINSTYYLDV
ncbi:MAG: carboxypeptidase-like regulatory domain-containing protein [Candidatus Doudnabacteria bacterium]|nr:carboxypeptidase-like regulatory domain-containing protein [Candidatus Doudnabacteria bacterium]